MFYFISGELSLLKPAMAVINAGGVGFKLTVSTNTYNAIAQKEKQSVKLFTHLAMREDDMELFGFADEAELEAFKLLITVSGVGPKAAMGVLSAFTPDQLMLAICTDDKKGISKAPGIGPKTAARIVLELHDKVAGSDLFPVATAPTITSTKGAAAAAPIGGALNEAQEALLVLGYNRTEILGVLHSINTAGLGADDIIRAALKKLMR